MSGRPIPPRMPECLREEIRLLERPVTVEAIEGGLLEQVFATLTRTPEQAAEIRRYDAEVAEYNKAVDAYNAPILAARQRRANEREAAATRTASCPRCYCIHAGDECY